MKLAQAVVDTSVIILLVAPRSDAETEEIKTKRARAELVLEGLLKQGAKLVVPTPVIAELCRHGPGSAMHKKLVSQLKRRIRTETLSVEAADVAGAMRRVAIAQRAQGDERGAILYDALIAGIAHEMGARWLVTTNPSDMQRCLKVVNSPVEVIDAAGIPVAGQLNIVHIKPATGG